MADPTTHERRLTGDDILSELIRNADEGIFKIRYTALVPCIFDVYLHSDDYDQIRSVIPALRSEAKRTLGEHLAALNGKGSGPALVRMLGLDTGKRVDYKILEPDWSIQFHPDTEDRLERGAIEIYSELANEPRPEYADGAMTTLITRRDAEGNTTALHETAPVKPIAETYAVLTYEENGEQRRFAITKDAVAIGRGGKTYWVDVKVDGPPDVSREHCRIRRDPMSNRFYLKDVSQFGTTLNGIPVPPGVERSGGQTKETGAETPLPSRARIGLAEVVFLDFEAS